MAQIATTPNRPILTKSSTPKPIKITTTIVNYLKITKIVNFVSKLKIPIRNFSDTSSFHRQSVDLQQILKSTPQNTKNRQFLINSKRQKSTQKVEKLLKITKFQKFLNHVFKTSKKTLSYSRTYCKIYKIENIGKIGRHRGRSC